MASPSESEGLKKPRSILLLWFLRHVMGVDDLEAYEYICDGDLDQGIDGLLIEAAAEPAQRDSLVLLQSKYPEGPVQVGVNDLKSFVGTAASFRSVEGFRSFLQNDIEAELGALTKRFNLEDRLAAKDLDLKYVFVTAGYLNRRARKYVSEVNAAEGAGRLRVFDLDDLAPLVDAFQGPQTVDAMATLRCRRDQRFVTHSSTGKVVVASISAADIVGWPGIADRSLFDLNVRRQLKRNPVRRALEAAIERESDHQNFLAFHNGLTVICERIDDSNIEELVVERFSVANGAQSTLAFYESRQSITDNLRVLVKFVEARPDQQLAREVAVRSNNQNPVTPRNLRARDGLQLALEEQFRRLYPRYRYETRPDAGLVNDSFRVIQNDYAAQLLCSVFNRRPWIAIKRTALFESDYYRTVFSIDLSADHVVLAYKISEAVQAEKHRFPESYLRSWQLTKLTAVYVVGELLRADADGDRVIQDPSLVRVEELQVDEVIQERVRFAAAAMKRRHDRRKLASELDDFKVDFKREEALRHLASDAREAFVTYQAVEL